MQGDVGRCHRCPESGPDFVRPAIEPVNIHQAQTRLSRLLHALEQGEEAVIARADAPIARLVGRKTPAQPVAQRPGRCGRRLRSALASACTGCSRASSPAAAPCWPGGRFRSRASNPASPAVLCADGRTSPGFTRVDLPSTAADHRSDSSRSRMTVSDGICLSVRPAVSPGTARSTSDRYSRFCSQQAQCHGFRHGADLPERHNTCGPVVG